MLCPDVNVLIYAHRADINVHEPYRKWLEELVAADEPFALSTLVSVAFVRIVTNRKAFAEPTDLSTALAFIDLLIAQPGCNEVQPGPAHWSLVSKLCRHTHATSKLVADAAHAAVAIEHGCQWTTRDTDFAKFEASGLRWKHLHFEAPTP